MSITQETRAEAYEAVKPRIPKRTEIIMDMLDGNSMTASEIAQELFKSGLVPYYSRNFAAPRLTELKKAGLVETCGKRYGLYSYHFEAVWRRTDQ